MTEPVKYRVRVVSKADWVPQGKMLIVEADMIVASPTGVFDRLDRENEPHKIIVCHSDFEALKVKVAVEEREDMELVE